MSVFKAPTPANTFCEPERHHSRASSIVEEGSDTPILRACRSTSLPAGRPLKSALASPSSPSSPASDTEKHAHFDDQNLEIEECPRRSATDSWSSYPCTVAALDLRRLSATPANDDGDITPTEDVDLERGPEHKDLGNADGDDDDDFTPSEDFEDAFQSPLNDDLGETEPISGQSHSDRRTSSETEPSQSYRHDNQEHQSDARESQDEPARTVHEWSGDVNELPSIAESDTAADEDAERIPAKCRVPKIEPKRRSSDTHTRTLPTGRAMRRISSMSEICRLKGRLRVPALLSSKASPAGPAVTACSIHIFEPPRLNTVYESPTECEGRQTAHTVHSDHGTVQMVWEEPAISISSSVATVLVDDSVGLVFADDIENHIVPPSPRMERVKTKLTAWSWGRELTDELDDKPRWLPLMDLNDERHRSANRLSDHSPISEAPLAPPNTARQSGQSSAKHSEPQSPAAESSESSSDDSPIELKARSKPQTAQPTRSPTPDYLSIIPLRRSSMPASPSISKNLCSLGTTDDLKFRSHRDSVEITHGHIKRHEEEGPMNQELLNSRDSFDLTKSKLAAKYPRAVTPTIQRSRLGALSPIADLSPPPTFQVTAPEEGDRGGEEERHPDEHENCPICEEHRPRWFEARHRKW